MCARVYSLYTADFVALLLRVKVMKLMFWVMGHNANWQNFQSQQRI